MKISEKRRQAIYKAVHDEITDLRIALRKQGVSDKIDHQIAQAGDRAGVSAICAAEGKPHA